ncbi:DUF1127 domain-containing protein [Fulvimarina endophytica]|uniref:DUF1127 domain-containing protein n=1 Tax=Fulvimarina endophytica TaxID=2293836 RepID=A0A371X8G3_9HYPH|nr:DUF1127 domain-containing protein [Fulvimarina endophytica]RFC65529.1 DUF1127 domain-containing protein [Fulvimarina endophytica]
MAIFHRTTTDTLVQTLAEALRLAVAAVPAMVRTLRNRHAARQIADLPDYLLNDMGLKRDDVHDALQSDWRSDPTYLLSMRASRNTLGRRRR